MNARFLFVSVLSLFFVYGLFACVLYAHCEIPCGIYDDQARFAAMKEDVTTIEKGMTQINELEKNPSGNMNQIVRWVNNKEEHADRIKAVLADYFLSQRVKAPAEGDLAAKDAYVKQLVYIHEITVLAMKAKQTTDLAVVGELRAVIADYEAFYEGLYGHSH